MPMFQISQEARESDVSPSYHEAEPQINDSRETRYTLHQVKDFLKHDGVCQQSTYATTYEWPFKLYVDGNQQESFRGCGACRTRYRLEAVAITGVASNNPIDAVPIRIIRCPSLASYGLLNPATVQGSWGDSIRYEVCLGRRAAALGGTVPVAAKLTILLPGVQITAARFYLTENHMVCDKHDTGRVLLHSTKLVSTWPLYGCSGQQSHTWRESLPLSKAVRSCSPSFDAVRVKNSHAMHFAVTIIYGSGAQSEVGH